MKKKAKKIKLTTRYLINQIIGALNPIHFDDESYQPYLAAAYAIIMQKPKDKALNDLVEQCKPMLCPKCNQELERPDGFGKNHLCCKCFVNEPAEGL